VTPPTKPQQPNEWRTKTLLWALFAAAAVVILVVRYQRNGSVYLLGVVALIVGLAGIVLNLRKRNA
jgi:hypothetical protein